MVLTIRKKDAESNLNKDEVDCQGGDAEREREPLWCPFGAPLVNIRNRAQAPNELRNRKPTISPAIKLWPDLPSQKKGSGYLSKAAVPTDGGSRIRAPEVESEVRIEKFLSSRSCYGTDGEPSDMERLLAPLEAVYNAEDDLKSEADRSMGIAPSMTSKGKHIVGDAGERNQCPMSTLSPKKMLWTQVAAAQSSTDEISETAALEIEMEKREIMRKRVTQGDWYVHKRERVSLGKKIGEGGQAEIYEAILNDPFSGPHSVRAVAVKKFKLAEGVSQGCNPPGLSSIKCLHVCQPLGVFFDNGQLCMIMKRFAGDLRNLIDTEMTLHQAPPFPEPVAMLFIMQLAMGLKGLHDVGIYHRDIKSGNILVKKLDELESYGVYISDFESSDDVIGTRFYRAPEVLRRVQDRMQGRVPGPVKVPEHEWPAADVYSFGMTCYEILTGEVPKIGELWDDYSKALSGERPKIPENIVPEGLKCLIERCWHQDPSCRPNFDEILTCLKRIDNHGVPSAWVHDVEYMATLEQTSGILEEDLLELEIAILGQMWRGSSNLATEHALKFVCYVQEFIAKFHGYSHLQPQSFQFDEFVQLRKLLSLIDWKKCHFLWQGVLNNCPDAQDVRIRLLIVKVHALTNKTNLQRSRLAIDDGRIHYEEKLESLEDFVMCQLHEGIAAVVIWSESEIIIRQIDNTSETWGLRCLVIGLCLIHQGGFNRDNLINIFIVNSIQLLSLHGFCKILGSILGIIFGSGSSLIHYFFTPTIGFRLTIMRYIGLKLYSQYWPLLLFYFFILGTGEGFKYWFIPYALYYTWCIYQNVRAYRSFDFSPYSDFAPFYGVSPPS